MKIYTKIVINKHGETVESESYEYEGPIAECKGGKGGSQTPSSQALEEISRAMFAETTPMRQEFWRQAESILKTGGTGAYAPLISRAVESTRRATSETMRGLDERLAVMGLAGTPFGERVRAETARAGEAEAARIPAATFQSMLPMIVNAMLGQGQTVVTGLGSAAGAESRMRAADIAGQYALWSALMPRFTFTKAW
jgi:hypothetical protein